MRVLFLILLLLFGLAGPVRAQEAEAGLRARAEQVVELLRGGGDPTALFTPVFLAQVPPDQVRAVSRQLAAQYGAVRGLAGVDAASAQAGVIHVAFERGTVHMRIVLEPDPPGRVAGLLVTGAETQGDSLSGVVGEMRALPGTTSLAVARLGPGAPQMLASLEPDRPMAIGSAFKLFILAELTRQVQAGRRHWSDVVALDRHSIPTGSLQTWPLGSPVTLHTLGALMISVSDNTAADVLLHTLGRENVERMMTTIGVADPARNIPFLSTLEVSTLKTAPAPALNAWLQADAAGRRQLLARDYANPDPTRVDISRLEGGPLHIDSLEWFASTADLVKAMDWLRRNGDDTARAILAINGALGPNSGGFAYAGYKGGSEAGVLNLTWLVRNRSGVWHALSGTWNDPAARLEESRFIGLMARVAQQLR